MTGSEENATILNPTVLENLLFPSSSPSAKLTRRFPQAQSMVAYGANHLRIYKKMEIWINHISNILYYENYFANNVLNFVLRSYHIGDAIKIDEYVPQTTPTISGSANALMSATPNT